MGIGRALARGERSEPRASPADPISPGGGEQKALSGAEGGRPARPRLFVSILRAAEPKAQGGPKG